MAAVTAKKKVAELDQLPLMLNRLKLTAIRDQLDSLLDQAARAEMNIREALAMLCGRGGRAQGRATHPDGHVDRQVPVRAHARGL